MSHKSIFIRIPLALAGAGLLSCFVPAAASPFDISVLLGDLGINIGNNGWPQQYTYFQPPAAYTSYYSQPLYAQYIMWYYYPQSYYQYYPSPPPPLQAGAPPPLPPPAGAPLPPPGNFFHYLGVRQPPPPPPGAALLQPPGPPRAYPFHPDRPRFGPQPNRPRPESPEFYHGPIGGPARSGPGPQFQNGPGRPGSPQFQHGPVGGRPQDGGPGRPGGPPQPGPGPQFQQGPAGGPPHEGPGRPGPH